MKKNLRNILTNSRKGVLPSIILVLIFSCEYRYMQNDATCVDEIERLKINNDSSSFPLDASGCYYDFLAMPLGDRKYLLVREKEGRKKGRPYCYTYLLNEESLMYSPVDIWIDKVKYDDHRFYCFQIYEKNDPNVEVYRCYKAEVLVYAAGERRSCILRNAYFRSNENPNDTINLPYVLFNNIDDSFHEG